MSKKVIVKRKKKLIDNPSHKYTESVVEMAIKPLLTMDVNSDGTFDNLMSDGKRAVVLYGQFKNAKLKDGKNAFLFPNKYEFNAVDLKDETESLFKIRLVDLLRWMMADDFDFGMKQFKRDSQLITSIIDNPLVSSEVAENEKEYLQKWTDLALPNENKYIYVFKSDFPMIYDYRNMSVPFHLTKLRKIHFCKHCDWYYRSGCRCVKNAKLKGYGQSSVNAIFDISKKGIVETLDSHKFIRSNVKRYRMV